MGKSVEEEGRAVVLKLDFKIFFLVLSMFCFVLFCFFFFEMQPTRLSFFRGFGVFALSALCSKPQFTRGLLYMAQSINPPPPPPER